jgi:hypothetical protein
MPIPLPETPVGVPADRWFNPEALYPVPGRVAVPVAAGSCATQGWRLWGRSSCRWAAPDPAIRGAEPAPRGTSPHARGEGDLRAPLIVPPSLRVAVPGSLSHQATMRRCTFRCSRFVAAPRPVGTRLCPSGRRGKQAGLVGGARRSLSCGRLLRQTPRPPSEELRRRPYRASNGLVSPECGSGGNELR